MKLMSCNGKTAYLNYLHIDKNVNNKVLLSSTVARSGFELRGLLADAQLGFRASVCNLDDSDSTYVMASSKEHSSYVSNFTMGKEVFYHGILINKNLIDPKGEYFMIPSKGEFNKAFFEKLIAKYDLPLLEDWVNYIYSRMLEGNLIYTCDTKYNDIGDSLFPVGDKTYNLNEVIILKLSMSEEQLRNIVSTGLKTNSIKICDKKQTELEFDSMNDYFAKYGHAIVESISKKITPKVKNVTKVPNLVTMNKQLFEEQANCTNGIAEVTRTQNAVILNEGMGTGKTLQSAAAVEAHMVSKYLRVHPKATLEEAVRKTTYRVAQMCPGHLPEKWAAEVREEIPFAKTFIIHNHEQVIDLLKLKGTKPDGKEIYIFAKDFAKLSFQYKPSPYKFKVGEAYKYVCSGSRKHKVHPKDKVCKECGEDVKREVRNEVKGLVCPDCGSILIDENNLPLGPLDFMQKTSRNITCTNCDSFLWEPYVPKYQVGRGADEYASFQTNSKWYKVTHYANKAEKTKVSNWVHVDFYEAYLERKGLRHEQVSRADNTGQRKFAPARFIKKKLGKLFDFFIADEAQNFKGQTAQGNAFHCLVRSSKKQLALTGTIAGGYANHIFYLFWRMYPNTMQKFGYEYSDEMKFARDYGVVEDVYYKEGSREVVHNASSKGVTESGSTPTIKPGISPLLFSHFLLPNAVFLDLSDLSRYLPNLYEKVELLDMDPDVEKNYRKVEMTLSDEVKCKDGRCLMGAMLQTLLAYPDKPFGMDDIIHPQRGSRVMKIPSVDMTDRLLPKEEYIINEINQEISEGRRVFLYLEFTGKGDKVINTRYKELIEKHCNLKGKVAILKSSSPTAKKRELWLKKQAKMGKQVVICNPKLVETGMDFCFKYEDIVYNYPTILFGQLGYNMFTLWQASRRHYRLNQKEECRTKFIGYKNTMQHDCIVLMAEKRYATAAIQGTFSSEGLNAMAKGTDVKMKLAEKLRNNSQGVESDNQLDAIKMMEFANEQENKKKVSLADRPVDHELIEMRKKIKELIAAENTASFEINDVFDGFTGTKGFYNMPMENTEKTSDEGHQIERKEGANKDSSSKKETYTKTVTKDKKSTGFDPFDLFNGVLPSESIKITVAEPPTKKRRARKSKALEGEISLLDFI